jgi:hypothetical protein
LSRTRSAVVFSEEVGLSGWAVISLAYNRLDPATFGLSRARNVDLKVLVVSISSGTPVEFRLALFVAVGDGVFSPRHNVQCVCIWPLAEC